MVQLLIWFGSHGAPRYQSAKQSGVIVFLSGPFLKYNPKITPFQFYTLYAPPRKVRWPKIRQMPWLPIMLRAGVYTVGRPTPTFG